MAQVPQQIAQILSWSLFLLRIRIHIHSVLFFCFKMFSRFTSNGFQKTRFFTPVLSDLECSSCHDVAREPRCCSKEHIFCLDCVTESLKSKYECPACRIILTTRTLVPLTELKQIVYDSLLLKCAAAVSGCEFFGTINEIVDHEKVCDLIQGNRTEVAAASGGLREQMSPLSVVTAGHANEMENSSLNDDSEEEQKRQSILCIKTITGTKYIIYSDRRNTAFDLKNLIEIEVGVPNDRQRLFYKNEQLVDNRTLASYDIPAAAMVVMITPTLGCGCGCRDRIHWPELDSIFKSSNN